MNDTRDKECVKCGESKPRTDFYAHKRGAGGVMARCKACILAGMREKAADPERAAILRARSAAWSSANKERVRELGRIRAAKAAEGKEKRRPSPVTKETLTEQWRAYYQKNREAINKRNRERYRAKGRSDAERLRARESAVRRRAKPAHAMAKRVSKAVRRSLARKGAAKTSPTFKALGYTPQEMARHIERQFIGGMGWHNKEKWHIDHIIPLSSFDVREMGDAQFMRAWALPNLRPIWALDNLRKGVSVETLV